MLSSPSKSDEPLNRFHVTAQSNRSAINDAVIVAALCVTAWVLIERTDACTRFFQFVSANPDLELDSIILAGIFSTIGVLVFAMRRWREARNAQRRANRLAYHDPLTGLPNRRAFVEALEHASWQQQLACLLFDLNDFKQVNDLRGHLMGDRLLQILSRRLSQSLPPNVLLARIGGDEFALLLPVDDLDQALHVADLVVDCVGKPLRIDGHEVQVGVSVGLACFPADADRADALLSKADIALYRAKAQGRSAVRVFEPSMEEEDLRYAVIGEALRDAIPNGEIAAHYQPIVELATGRVIAFEALARWTSPRLGAVTPSEFIPIATESGLITELWCHLFEQVCAHAVQWPRHLRVSCNIAPRQLCDPLLPLHLLAILSKTGLAPGRVEIEMTEEALLANDRLARSNLEVLKDQGITFALDDFGTGYSSLHHLRTLAFDKVKIDRSYVARIESCDDSRRMVAAIINFTRSLGIPVLAEGVETPEQAQILTAFGCDLAQGWLFGKAEPNSALARHFAVALPPASAITA